MDKMCNNSEADDLNKTITKFEEREMLKKSESPVFKCFSTKTSCAPDSSDYDIPSYQMNQSFTSRTSSKCDNETNDFVLPFSPIFSPVPVNTIQCQPPSIHSLGTVVKNIEKSRTRVKVTEQPCVFQILGMNDKDISWVSSMASPTPKQLPGSDFNTIEKATFFPEEKFQNIQPRALFSPTSDNDFGCQPISSDSDEDEAYKTNIRLSDVCATLNQLEFKSLEYNVEDNSVDFISSPVIKMKKFGGSKKKRQAILVKSPQDTFEFSNAQDNSDSSSGKGKGGSTLIEDDSFQSMSFSCLDELCKTVIEQVDSKSVNVQKKFYLTDTSETYKMSSLDGLHSYARALEEADASLLNGRKLDKSLANKNIVRLDQLQDSKIDAIKRSHSKLSDVKNESSEKKVKVVDDGWVNVKEYLSESQLNVSDDEIFRTVENLEKTLASQESRELKLRALEEADASLLNGRKLDKSLANKNIVGLDQLQVKNESSEKEVKVVDDGWVNVKEYLSESQLNVSDDEIFRTVENLEKTLASQESRELKLSGEVSQEKTKDEEHKCSIPDASQKLALKTKALISTPQAKFITASGTEISVLEKSLTKARQLLKNCEKEVNKPVSFSTKSGKLIQVSYKGLEKGKTLLSDCEAETPRQRFSGMLNKLKVSPEALEKARALMEECDKSKKIQGSELLISETLLEEKPEKHESNVPRFQGFLTGSGKTIKVSSEALQKAKALMLESEESESFELEKQNSSNGFSTAFNKQVQVSEESLKKAKALKEDCDKKATDEALEILKPEELNNLSFQGFSTGSGKTIQVSSEALEKAKSLMLECEESESFEHKKQNSSCGFSTASGKQVQVSEEFLKKATNLLEDVDKNVKAQSFEFWQPTRQENKVYSETLKRVEPENLSKFSFKGFSTGSGKQIEVCDEALKKAKALMENCDKKATGEALERVKPENSNNLSFQGFLSGSGKQIKVSDEAMKKAKSFMEDCCDELSTKAVKEVSPDELNMQGFLSFSKGTGTGTTIQVSAEALNTEKQIMKNESTDELASIWMNELANENFGEIKSSKRGEQTENFSNITDSKIAQTKRLEETGNPADCDDWDKIIPSWLHVYNTSPSIASDRLELTPFVSHENGNTSKPEREYIKSPVLGVGDRFYQKVKRRKLKFTDEPASSSSVRKTVKRTSNLSIDFSAPFKKPKFLELDNVDVDVKAERRRAREQQERAIKEKEKVKPLKGLLLTRKCVEKRIKWAEAVGDSSPGMHSKESLKSMGVREEVLRVCIENAAGFKFKGEDFFGSSCVQNVEGLPIGDGCFVILDDENQFGVEELLRAFLLAPGVQPNLLPSGWVENHYKWIVWKLAHYEKSLPRYFAGRCLTPNNVMLQLKYRYDREIDRNERSALKKILERDDTSVKRMVLCVCGIKKVIMGETSGYELSLTDGWYSCPARVDAAMSRLIESGKLFIGTKLLTQGAALVNCEQGVSPLEICGDVYLKISTNSTRRVKWDTKLGFQSNPKNFPISLTSILPQGGAISRLDVIIVRVYPVLYMEKISDGHHVTRNRRSEEKAEAEYRRIQEQLMERVWNEVQSEMRSSREKIISEGTFNRAEEEEELSQSLGGCSGPTALKGMLTENHFGREFSDRVEKKLKNEKLEKRNVSAFMRAKIVDFRKPDYNNPAVLSVWNPSEDVIGLLSEGKILSLMNITISNSSRVYKTLQINTTRQTQFRPISRTAKYPTRKLTGLTDVSSKICPAFEEVDVVGMVALIRDVSYGSRLTQVVYLTDFEFNFVGIVFWGSCRDYGWENVLKVRSIVACSNLQWKKTVSTKEVPSLHVSENSVFTENPRQAYLKDEIARLKETIPKDLGDFLSKCEEELTVKLEESKWPANRSLDKSKSLLSNGFGTIPTASSTPIKALPMRMSLGSCAEPSPIQKRIEKLQMYGEPPSLIPLLIRNRKVKKKSL